MRRMQNEFKCDTCDTWIPGTISIAEDQQEFDKLSAQMPAMTVQLGKKVIFRHDCPNANCTGKINVVYIYADF